MATYTQDGVLVDDQPTADPNIRKVKVPAGMAVPEYITSVSAGFPNAQFDTWYYPTEWAYLVNRFVSNYSAAYDTVTDAAGNVIDTVGDFIEGTGTAGKWAIVGLGLYALIQILDRTKK